MDILSQDQGSFDETMPDMSQEEEDPDQMGDGRLSPVLGAGPGSEATRTGR